jgi:hypothetical protein
MWYLFGPTTTKGHQLFCFLEHTYDGTVTVGGLKNKVVSATHLATGNPVDFKQLGPQVFLHNVPLPQDAGDLPVVCLTLDGPPAHDLSEVLGGADIFPNLPV